MKEPVFCRDCANNRASWFQRTFGNSIFWQCEAGTQPKFNLVTGQAKHLYSSCSSNREIDSVCGREGKLWRPRNEKKHLFTLLKKI